MSKLPNVFKRNPQDSPNAFREEDEEAVLARNQSNTTTVTIPNSKSSTASSNHSEKHGKYSAFMGDAIIGFADGLTVPFALTAGLSACVTFTHSLWTKKLTLT
jgi:hypothetical protein